MFQENHGCTNCSQQNCFVSKYCTDPWKNIIEKNKTIAVYQKRQSIFLENNIGFGMYFIKEGKVKIFKTGKEGKNLIIRFAVSGDIIGFKGYSEKNYSVSCTTLEKTVVCFLENKFFFSAIKENPELALALVQYYAFELEFSGFHQKSLMQFNTRNRVAEALLIINKQFGKKTTEGTFLDVNLSQQDIADITGSTVEQVNRTLSCFKKEKIITIDNKKITLSDVGKLFDMILDDCCDRDMYINQRGCCEHLL